MIPIVTTGESDSSVQLVGVHPRLTTVEEMEDARPTTQGMASADPASREESKSEVDAMDGINMHLAQVMSHYQREEQKCFMCGSSGDFAKDCPHCDAFERWHHEQLNAKGVGENNLPTLQS